MDCKKLIKQYKERKRRKTRKLVKKAPPTDEDYLSADLLDQLSDAALPDDDSEEDPNHPEEVDEPEDDEDELPAEVEAEAEADQDGEPIDLLEDGVKPTKKKRVRTPTDSSSTKKKKKKKASPAPSMMARAGAKPVGATPNMPIRLECDIEELDSLPAGPKRYACMCMFLCSCM